VAPLASKHVRARREDETGQLGLDELDCIASCERIDVLE
jgi:hypothetical protein